MDQASYRMSDSSDWLFDVHSIGVFDALGFGLFTLLTSLLLSVL